MLSLFFFAQGRCYGCMSYGNVDLKHPVNADKYEGLYSGPFNLCCGVVPELDVGHCGVVLERENILR